MSRRNITLNSVQVLWNPSVWPNGVIRCYHLQVTDVAGNLTTTLNTSLLEVTLERLEPYSVYTVSVCAFTIKCSATINLTAKTLGGMYTVLLSSYVYRLSLIHI